MSSTRSINAFNRQDDTEEGHRKRCEYEDQRAQKAMKEAGIWYGPNPPPRERDWVGDLMLEAAAHAEKFRR